MELAQSTFEVEQAFAAKHARMRAAAAPVVEARAEAPKPPAGWKFNELGSAGCNELVPESHVTELCMVCQGLAAPNTLDLED